MKNSTTARKLETRTRRHARVRAKVFGTAERPRLSVFRSNRGIFAQLIDDEKGVTVLGLSSLSLSKGTPVERARKCGVTLAEKAKVKKISTVVFDRGGFLYAGAVKALAEGAREGGITF